MTTERLEEIAKDFSVSRDMRLTSAKDYSKIYELLTAVRTLTQSLAEVTGGNERLTRIKTFGKCAYCMAEFPCTTDESGRALLLAHVQICEKNPLTASHAENARLISD